MYIELYINWMLNHYQFDRCWAPDLILAISVFINHKEENRKVLLIKFADDT